MARTESLFSSVSMDSFHNGAITFGRGLSSFIAVVIAKGDLVRFALVAQRSGSSFLALHCHHYAR